MNSRDLTGTDTDSWAEPEKQSRDWKKIILVLGLGMLSWAATYVGMLELIQANLGDLPFSNKIIIGFSVAMLMTMIIWLLDQIFSPVHVGTKFFFVLGYIFLTVISVGFGFGFYWKVLESRGEATRSAESAIGQVQNSLHAGLTRLEQLTQTLVQLEQVSTQKAVEEREKGTSCPNSRPGDGPRRKLRDADAESFRFASQFVSTRVGAVKTDLSSLDSDLQKVVKRDESTVDEKTGTRNDFLRDLNRRLEITVTGFNAFRTDPQLRQLRSDLNDRAGKTVFPNNNGGTFSCPDAQLQAALRGVVRAVDQLPDLTKPEIAAVEGSEATIEAFRRLTASLTGLLTLTPPLTPDELRARQQKAVQSVSDPAALAKTVYEQPTGLGKRDYVPLAIAIFVDLCLLLVSIGRPMNRLNGLIPKMREAEKGPVIRILSRFNEIHRDPEIRQNFEVFRHVVFDYLGDYYVAVPLDTPYNRTGPRNSAYYGAADAQELQHEAHLLANLFASFEKEKIFKRVFFMPMRTVRSRLRRQGSKFAGTTAFRVYRFTEGAWSDIILGAVMGAAKRVEAEKAQRKALEDELLRDLQRRNPAKVRPEPSLTGFMNTGPSAKGEAGPSGKAPPFVMAHAPDTLASRIGATRPVSNGADISNLKNGHAGTSGSNGHASPARNAIFIDEDFDDDELAILTAEDEAQIRSRYGKYADTVLAERTSAVSRKNGSSNTANGGTNGSEANGHGATGADKLESAAANSNTMPSKPANGSRAREDVLSLEEMNGDAPKIIQLPAAAAAGVNGTDKPVAHGTTLNGKIESRGRSNGWDDTDNEIYSPRGPEATVKVTRETATYSIPVSEAVLPVALRNAVSRSTPVVTSQAVLKDETAQIELQPQRTLDSPRHEHEIVDALAQAIPSRLEDTTEDGDVPAARQVDAAPISLTPPPLPVEAFANEQPTPTSAVDDVVIAVANRFKSKENS